MILSKKKILLFIIGIGLSIAVFIFYPYLSGKYIYETEKNNSFKNANIIKNIHKIKDFVIIKGNIESEDVDFYTIDLRPSDFSQKKEFFAQITLSAIKGFDARLIIYKNKVPIKIIDDFRRNEKEQIFNFFFEEDLYHIQIQEGFYQYWGNLRESSYNFNYKNDSQKNTSKTDLQEPYELQIIKKDHDLLSQKKEIKKHPIKIEKEPNDSFEFAQEVEVDEILNSYFTPFYSWEKTPEIIHELKTNKNDFLLLDLCNNIFKKDYCAWLKNPKNKFLNIQLKYDFDWYRVFPKEDQHLNIYVQTFSKITQTFILGVLDSQYNLVFINNDFNFKEKKTISHLFLEKDKPYYIFIIGIPSDIYSTQFLDNQYHYQIYLEGKKVKSSSYFLETEPNNNLKNANYVQSHTKVEGILNHNEEQDCYKLLVDNKKDKNIESNELHSSAFLNLNFTSFSKKKSFGIDLYDQKKQLIRSYNNLDKENMPLVENLYLSNNKKVYLCVNFDLDKKKEAFDIGKYQFNFDITRQKDKKEVEINDHLKSSSTALNYIQLNEKMEGKIYPGSFITQSNKRQKADQDLFLFYLEKGKTYEFKIKGIKNIQLEVDLFNYEDKELIFPYRQVLIVGDKKEDFLFSPNEKNIYKQKNTAIKDSKKDTQNKNIRYLLRIRSKFPETASLTDSYDILIREKN